MAEAAKVAVFWDFENLVIGQYNYVHDRYAWKNDTTSKRKERQAAARLKLEVILGHAVSLGSVVLNRAYCDWSRQEFHDYGDEFVRHDVDLVQQFSSDTGKNGADIRIAVDLVETMRWRDDITDVLVCSGDSDFLPLVEFCLRSGRRIHAVGVKRSTSEVWRKTCDFHSYQELTLARRVSDLAGARRQHSQQLSPTTLLGEALRLLPSGQWVDFNHLGPLMRRLQWAFDVSEIDHRTTSALVAAAVSEGVVEQSGDSHRRIRLRVDRAEGPGSPRHPVVVRSATAADGPDPTDSTLTQAPVYEPRRLIAVYWDLEDLVSAEYDRVNGWGEWTSDRVDGKWIPKALQTRITSARINTRAVLRFIGTIGTIAINRMYADWTRQIFRTYHQSVSERTATDFVQVHRHRRAARALLLPMNVVADVQQNPAITDVVVCAGVAGFDALADFCLREGKSLHAIGVTAQGNAGWRRECEFKNYSDVVPARPDVAPPSWAKLLTGCLPDPGQRVGVGSLKSEMKTKDIAFNEKALGYSRFWEFLKAAEQLQLVVLEDEGGPKKWVRLGPRGVMV